MVRTSIASAAPLLEQPAFIAAYVAPLVRTRVPEADRLGITVCGGGGLNRATVEYQVGTTLRIFAKQYADTHEGQASFEIVRTLAAHGFAAPARHRITDVLGYVPEQRVLLMCTAPGESLYALKAQGWDVWQHGLREAARWLAQLHSTPAPLGPSETVAQGVFRLAHRATKAAARQPEHEQRIVHLLDELAAREQALIEPRPHVPTHGRYHSRHVFLAPDAVTVIDPDRAALADPAKDVAEFVHRLRDESAKVGIHAFANRATSVFLEEYTRHSQADLSGLLYYWSYSIVFTLLHLLRKNNTDDPQWHARVAQLHTEFETLPERIVAYHNGGG